MHNNAIFIYVFVLLMFRMSSSIYCVLALVASLVVLRYDRLRREKSDAWCVLNELVDGQAYDHGVH